MTDTQTALEAFNMIISDCLSTHDEAVCADAISTIRAALTAPAEGQSGCDDYEDEAADRAAASLVHNPSLLTDQHVLLTSPPSDAAWIAELEGLEEDIAKIIHDEDETFDTTWPEGPDDDGHRGGGGYVRLPSEQDQRNLRHTADLIINHIHAKLKGDA